jgi:hypothetical protein
VFGPFEPVCLDEARGKVHAIIPGWPEGPGPPPASSSGYGIADVLCGSPPCGSNVIIANGTIQGFGYYGILLASTEYGTIAKINAMGNGRGIGLDRNYAVVSDDSHANNNAEYGMVFSGNNSTVNSSQANSNGVVGLVFGGIAREGCAGEGRINPSSDEMAKASSVPIEVSVKSRPIKRDCGPPRLPLECTLRADNPFGPRGRGAPLWLLDVLNAGWPPFSLRMSRVIAGSWVRTRKGRLPR